MPVPSLPSPAVQRAWARLTQAQRVVVEEVERRSKASGMPPLAWYDVLLELDRPEVDGMRPRDLEAKLLFAQYNLSRLLDRLEHAGLILREKCLEDGRGQIVRLTEEGRRVRRESWPVYGASLGEVFAGRLTDAETVTLAELLEKLMRRP